VRDFLHVQDVARAICTISGSSVQDAVNVGSGVPITVRDLAIKVGNLLKNPDLLRLGELPQRSSDPKFICANNGRLLSLGWKPRFNLEDGLLDAVNWWRAKLALGSKAVVQRLSEPA
jgi:nucleoside-diphosphate-sugar epimerase